MQETTDEVRCVNTCVNNLISIVALPAIWAGREAPEIVAVLMDVLLNMLQLDSVCVTLNGGASTSAVEMIRSIHSQDAAEMEVLLKETLQQSLTCEAWPFTIRRSMRSNMVSIAAYRLGIADEIGALVTASRRSDFPDANERLLLNVAANQAAIGLREARLLGEQKRLDSKRADSEFQC